MNRVTTRNTYGAGVLLRPAICERCGEVDYGPIDEAGNRVVERLAAYEDTGLTPEEVAELKGERERLRRILTANEKRIDDATRVPLMECPAGCGGFPSIYQRRDAPELFCVTCEKCGAHATVAPMEAMARKLVQTETEMEPPAGEEATP